MNHTPLLHPPNLETSAFYLYYFHTMALIMMKD